ncbi:hypothetical protein FACS189430_04490 [Bacteroidia bacterium]|nr:hypothetical protein FACS189430_04490 [Bacteroidia bacterium]
MLQVSGDLTCLIRRSRGYAPEPFFADIPTEGILAFGAEKVNTFALGKGNTVIQSQYIGDLKNAETFHFYTESMERFQRLFRFAPRQLVCDLHPDYLSTQYAEEMSGKQIPVLKVQHHHAHAAACMLEYGLHQPVIAVIWDGTGLGDDGTAWGGEFFICDRKQYSRISHMEYVPMPGGDKASQEPWRMAAACLHHYQIPFPAAFIERIGGKKIDRIVALMDKNLNAPLTSSAGRLFDAVTSLLGVCDTATRQAEAPIRLEQLAAEDCKQRYSADVSDNPISVRSIIQDILMDMQERISVEIIAAKFHNTLADLVVQKVKQISAQYGVTQVILSGGCFQNKRLTEEISRQMAQEKLSLYIPAQIPCNDGGIAAGQLTIAAALTN